MVDGRPLRARLTRDVVKADHTRITHLHFRQLVDALYKEGAITPKQRAAILLRANAETWEATARVLAFIPDTPGDMVTTDIASVEPLSVRTARTHYTRGVAAIMRAMEVT